ncbi:MAG: segregation/condensation protein A [Candidatus Omnitrophica bacterium]|nr:segregation/condensation protein A [Candidatus Omnitrophota bacterium]
MSYNIRLQVFEGPLDLLLYLIRKSEVDIGNIPIAEITGQYLEYLSCMQMLDMDVAGDFVVMAATLIQLKSRMLLPPDPDFEDEDLEEDPRFRLAEQLKEYEKVKEIAKSLQGIEDEQKNMLTRDSGLRGLDLKSQDPEPSFDVTLFDLIAAFSDAMQKLPQNTAIEIRGAEVTVEEKVHLLLHLLAERRIVKLSEVILEARSRIEIVVTFLAILELTRQSELLVRQDRPFSEIELVRNTDPWIEPESSKS